MGIKIMMNKQLLNVAYHNIRKKYIEQDKFFWEKEMTMTKTIDEVIANLKANMDIRINRYHQRIIDNPESFKECLQDDNWDWELDFIESEIL